MNTLPSQIVVFRADLHAIALDPYKLLSDEESARVARFAFDDLRRRYASAHALLRLVLGERLGQDPARLIIRADEFGKPRIEGATLRFSLSHSGRMAAIALSPGREVGVDIEEIRLGIEFDSIVDRYFTQREADALRLLPPAARRDAFYRCWTFKEAYLKALGKGLWGGLDELEVLPDAATARRGPWVVRAVPVPPGYAAAVATEGESRLRLFSVESASPLRVVEIDSKA